MVTLIATASYAAAVDALLDDEGRAEFEFDLACRPEAHPVVPGTGGVRKARWSRPGMGKRGGIRVVYYYPLGAQVILMVTAYTKNRKENLSDADKKAIRQTVEFFKASIRPSRP